VRVRVRVRVRHLSTTAKRGGDDHNDDDNHGKLHPNQNKSWNKRFDEFLSYKEANGGDVLIP